VEHGGGELTESLLLKAGSLRVELDRRSGAIRRLHSGARTMVDPGGAGFALPLGGRRPAGAERRTLDGAR
jgi:hypothetical protein